MDEELNPFLETELDEVDAAEAMLKAMETDDDNLSENGEEDPDAEEGVEENAEDVQDDAEDEDEDHEENAEEESEDDKDADDNDDEEAEEADTVEVDDEAEVEITVNGKQERVSIGSLKRLAGQEASLTQKAQAVSEQRRVLEAQGLMVTKVLQTRYENAKANVDKYSGVDLFKASRELEGDEFDALRSAKEAADQELATIEREGAEFVKQTNENRITLLREQAKESLKVIAEKIPDWSDKLYDEIRTYAVAQGMDTTQVNEVVDPSAIMMMHKAMQFDKVQSASAKVKKKVIKAPKKTVSKGSKATDTKASKMKSMHRDVLDSDGDIDDVTALFLASMEE